MKCVDVPGDVTILNLQSKEREPLKLPDGSVFTRSFKDYFFDTIANDQRAAKTPVQQAAWFKVINKVSALPDEKAKLYLEDAEHSLWLTISREPTLAWPPLVGCQTTVFHEAVESAKSAETAAPETVAA